MNQLVYSILACYACYVVVSQKVFVIKPQHASLESCAKVCASDKECRFFKFVNNTEGTGSCYLSSNKPTGSDKPKSSLPERSQGLNIYDAALKHLSLMLKVTNGNRRMIKTLGTYLAFMKRRINQKFAELTNQGKVLTSIDSKNINGLKMQHKILALLVLNVHSINKAFKQLQKVQSEIRSKIDKVSSGKNDKERIKNFKLLLDNLARQQQKYGERSRKMLSSQIVVLKALQKVNKRFGSFKPPEDAQDQLKKMKAAERARAYRERRRNDTQHKEKERQRKKEYRARMKESISNDEILRQREMSRIRQKRFNENKKRKLEGEGETEAVKPARAKKAITRRESLKQREYWRAKKREQRANMTSQKKRRIREKERARYAKRKQSLAPSTTFAETTTTSDSYTAPTESPSLLSSAATKQRAYRLKKNIPKTPEKFAQVMGHILLNSTPRQKTYLRRIGISSSPRKEEAYRYSKSIIETIRSIKEKRQQKWLAVKRCLITSMKSTRKARNYKKMSETTGLSYRALKKYTHDDLSDLTSYQRKRRQDCLTEETIEQVKSHYEASASFVPDNKAVSKKTFESQKVLDRPLARIYESFKSKHPDIDISQSKFSTLRPANVKTSKHQRLYQSMCEYCTNSKLKMQAINTVSERLQIQDCKLREIDDLVDLTSCKKMEGSEYHEKKCLTRDCDDCGVDGLDKFYGALIAATEREEDKVSWKHWSNVQYCQPGKRPSTRKTLLTKSTNLVELKDALKKDVASLSEHLLNAYWQKNCFQTLSKSVPKDSIVVHMDFSENYSTFYQQEISSAHWMKNLVTVHPSVAFYTCPDCGDTAKPVMDVLVFLSDDTNHDHHAVQTFVEETVRFLKEDRHLNFKNMYRRMLVPVQVPWPLCRYIIWDV